MVYESVARACGSSGQLRPRDCAALALGGARALGARCVVSRAVIGSVGRSRCRVMKAETPA